MTIHLSDWNGHVDAAAGSFMNLHSGVAMVIETQNKKVISEKRL